MALRIIDLVDETGEEDEMDMVNYTNVLLVQFKYVFIDKKKRAKLKIIICFKF